MKDARSYSPTIREIGRSDDEITLPLRIICERKPESAPVIPREEPKRKNARNYKEAQKPVRA